LWRPGMRRSLRLLARARAGLSTAAPRALAGGAAPCGALRALERPLALVVEALPGRRVQLGRIDRRPRRALPAAQHVGDGLADDDVGDVDRALGQLEPADHTVAARGEEVAGRELVAGVVVERLAPDLDLDVELAGLAARLRGQPAPRQDAAAVRQVRGHHGAQVLAGDVDDREAVVERQGLEQLAVGQ